MPARNSSARKKGVEPVNIENDSLHILMLMQKRKQKEMKYKRRGKMQDELNHNSFQSQKGMLELLVVTIIITLLIIGYTVWKDQSTSNANHPLKDTVVMKDLILNQIVQAQ